MILTASLFFAAIFLSYANGANDNFKGVATLFSSRTAGYKTSLYWATATTVLGSLFSVVLASRLIEAFSGRGLVTPELAGSPEFILTVALGAGATVILATIFGFPISTTHSIVGALVGSGLSANWQTLNLSALGGTFLAPLAFSPLIAAALAAVVYLIFKYARLKLGVTKETCVCVGDSLQLVPISAEAPQLQMGKMNSIQATIAIEQDCIERYSGSYFGINAQKALDTLHFLSAGLVCFARALNDTPKIMGLLLVIPVLDIHYGMIAISMAMACGGLFSARKVAYVMSRDITTMNHGQGFSANIVTGALVILASKFGLPVSTTHVAVGSLFGIGIVNSQANYRVIGKIVASWALTLPIAAIIAATSYLALFSK
ncbi:MAG: inorganic phosphate transporter [candidate division Zixibacteria bacterium]|nr:inorganic phosphate transporter [candidate division Zixibacteria bacterium]